MDRRVVKKIEFQDVIACLYEKRFCSLQVPQLASKVANTAG